MSDERTLLDTSGLDDASRAALRRLILTLADSKRLMGIRYSDWLLGAPSIETGLQYLQGCQRVPPGNTRVTTAGPSERG